MTTHESVPIEEACEWITQSVTDVFATMFGLEVQPAPPLEHPGPDEPSVAGSVGFAGEANGAVLVYVSDSFARCLTSLMLLMPPEEISGDTIVNDVVGELSNMIAGGVKSRLCDQGALCVLTVPSIVRGRCFKVQHVSATSSRTLGFRAGEHHFTIELITNSPQ